MNEKFPNNKIEIASLNQRAQNSAKELIAVSEDNYNFQLSDIATQVMKREKATIMLLAGPSASSKTTTSHKMKQVFCENGVHAVVISLDDFYVDREALPLLSNGEVDYESIDTLDLNRLEACFGELIENGKSEFPLFDFHTGRRCDKTQIIEIGEKSILIVEGLHALNPQIINGYPKENFVKVYISPNSDYCINEKIVLPARDLRLIRRLIRDYFHRSSSLANTLKMWVNVIIAEACSIFPFQKEADFIIDSAVIYEPCIYVHYLEKLLASDDGIEDIFKPQIERIRAAMELFAPIDISYLPIDTVLREFLD